VCTAGHRATQATPERSAEHDGNQNIERSLPGAFVSRQGAAQIVCQQDGTENRGPRSQVEGRPCREVCRARTRGRGDSTNRRACAILSAERSAWTQLPSLRKGLQGKFIRNDLFFHIFVPALSLILQDSGLLDCLFSSVKFRLDAGLQYVSLYLECRS